MAQNLNPAVELLVAQIDELERKANAYKASVNVLCEKDGLPPMFPDDGGGGGRRLNGQGSHEPSATAPTSIKHDAFYGKPQQTAVRELFAIRRAAGNGAAKPAEILEGLKAGGYVVEAKSDDIALVGLRAMLRKRNTIFHKLPNGTWGLKEWYPAVKQPKDGADKSATVTAKDAGVTEPPVAENEAKTEAAVPDDEATAAA
jgi:hypothetical protein